ncbi:MAG: acyl-CoA dehydrogenase [Acidobacteria bacterium]|nr:acyl-CoA dehydrogenase [Acidobacteriota bacterium]
MSQVAEIRAFLDPAHTEFAERCGAYCREELRALPEPHDDDAARVQAREVLDWMGHAGWFGPIAEGDLRELCLLREAVASASPLADAVVALQGLSITPLLLAENEAMRSTWLQPALQGAAMGAFALTEAEAGSDVAAIATTAVRHDDVYVLNGEKTFISNAGIADFYIVFATTDPSAGTRGLTAFVVGAATPGFEFVAPQVLSSPHPLGTVAFRDCAVPSACRLGDEGQGFKLGMMTLDKLRVSVGAAACGMAARALEESLAHVAAREQFGKPLAEYQLVQDKLARMYVELAASRLLVYRAAWEKDQGAERLTLEAATAKVGATEAAQRIIDHGVQLLGGRGVLANNVVDRMYRSIRALRIYEGTSEIQHIIIARQLLAAAQQEA